MMKEKPILYVSTNRRSGAVGFSDDGCGVPSEHQARIFEPFVSLRQGGTGLGLAVSLNFVRAWGGDITVESAPWRGSTFTIVLPAVGGEGERIAS